MCIFHDFRLILEVSWDSAWAHIDDCSVIWGAKMGDCFQVRVFGDPEKEMMPDCRGCMCYNHGKTDVFERFHFFHFFTKLVSQGLVLGGFLCLWVTFVNLFLILVSVGDRLEI